MDMKEGLREGREEEGDKKPNWIIAAWKAEEVVSPSEGD